MATKHYYAMHTPKGTDVIYADARTTPGTVIMFDRKHERDAWVADHEYDARTGDAHQTMIITEHEARVTMLRQYGRDLYEMHELDGFPGSYESYRVYAQYCPTAIMYGDYDRVVYRRLW